MKHRSYQGKVLCLSDDKGERGRDMFYVTIQPDGTRTMRATCEMDDDRLLRDAVLTVDADWYPVDAFVRLTIEEQLVGTTWYRFTEHEAECEGFSAKEGRFAQQFESDNRIRTFGAHPVHGDAWGLAKWKRDKDKDPSEIGMGFSSSHMPNGGSGPRLELSDSSFARHAYIRAEEITVPAGTFQTEHFQFSVGDYPPIDIWAIGEDCIPARLRWDLLKQTYDLVELSGYIQ
jgi:hypothetical protein